MKYQVIVPKRPITEHDDVRDARIELNYWQDQMCSPGTFKLRSLNPQCLQAYIKALPGLPED